MANTVLSQASSAERVVHEAYRALGAHDVAALVDLLHPSFEGHVSEGMPLGVGGPVHGPEAMLRGVWGRIARAYDVAPVPDEIVEAKDGRFFVIGRYRGRAREGGEVVAAFVHVLSVRDGRVASLIQVTDTARWVDAKTPVGTNLAAH